jgi:hypothetical protein
MDTLVFAVRFVAVEQCSKLVDLDVDLHGYGTAPQVVTRSGMVLTPHMSTCLDRVVQRIKQAECGSELHLVPCGLHVVRSRARMSYGARVHVHRSAALESTAATPGRESACREWAWVHRSPPPGW